MDRRTKNVVKKAAVKTIKKTHKSIIICFISFLILGIGGGFATIGVLTSNDTFEIIGEQTITLNLDDTYRDAGFKAIEFNNDVSSKVVVEGLDSVDTSTEGVYTISYTLNSSLYKNVKLYRYIVVESGENNE